jgi:UDP-N-acetylmuramyl pentapeptide phosphotransferase/UDP-N-acetylglucosamine-1-phosphate transferase
VTDLPLSTALPFALAFVVTLVATGVARAAALRAGALDVPTGRSSHALPRPRTGGFGLVAGFSLGWIATAGAASVSSGGPPALAVGAFLFFAVGALDDLRGLRPASKLLLHVAAASATVALGMRFDAAAWGGWPGIELGAAAPAVTVLLVLGIVNVVNFMDGIDAITSATTLVVLGSAAGAARGSDATPYLAAAGAVAGFLPWNVPPARIFMGDGGSHLLGFLCASAALSGPGGPSPGTAPWPVVLAALVPSFLDVAGGLLRKARAGLPLSLPHNDHRYQRLVKAGRGHGAVALRYGALAAALALAAGPLSAEAGPAVGAAVGAALLLAHLVEAAAATASVPRLERTARG